MHQLLRSDSGGAGSVWPGGVAGTAEYLICVFRIANKRTAAVARRIDVEELAADLVWERELAQGSEHPFPWGLPLPSVAAGPGGHVCLISGSERLLANAGTGEVLAQVRPAATPSGPAVLAGREFLVPEGRALASYDTETLALRCRRDAPHGLWAGPLTPGLCSLRDASLTVTEPQVAGLWNLKRDAFVEIPGSYWISARPVAAGGYGVLSCGGGAGDRLIGVDLGTGAVRWRAATAAAEPNLFKAPAPAAHPVDPAVVAYGEHVIAVTQVPSVEARVASSGDVLWHVALTEDPEDTMTVEKAQPTALAVMDGTVWVGLYDSRVMAFDAASGAPKGEIALADAENRPPVAFTRPPGEAGRAIAVTGSGTSYVLAI